MTRTRKRTTKAAAGAGIAGLIVTAALWGSTTTTAQAKDEGVDDQVFTIGMTNEVDSFNPFNGIEAESYEAWALMYDYMISYSDKDMSPQPSLATSWDTSDDGLTWTFHIRDDVKWTDGEPLTAKDIAYTYNRILDGGPESASWGSYLISVTDITAPDDTTVVMKLKKPNATLPLLPMPIIPEHIWKDVPEDEVKTYSNEPKSEDQPVVGSGPFKLVEGAAGGSTYRFVRNDDYWGGKPKMAEVDMTIYKSQDALVQSLKAGDIDFAEGVDPLQVKALQGQPGITAQQGSSPGFSEFAFNTGSVDVDTGKPLGDPNPALLDPKFRFALTFAIDRQEIVDKADQGAGIPAGNIIPPAYKGYVFQPPSDDAYAYDPEKAKQLLDEAGYTVGRRRLPDDARRRRRSASCGCTPGPTPQTSVSSDRLPPGVAEGRRHRLEGHLVRELQADQHHPGRRVRHLRVGLVRRARPGLDAQLLHLRPARQLVGLVVLQPGVRQALPGAERRDR